MIATPIFDDIL